MSGSQVPDQSPAIDAEFQREPEDRAEEDDESRREEDAPQVESERAPKGVRRE